jgi:hypothetical protein
MSSITNPYYPEYNVQVNSTKNTALPQAAGAQFDATMPDYGNLYPQQQQAPQQPFQQPYRPPSTILQQAPQQQYQPSYAIQQPASNYQQPYGVQQPTQSNWDSRGFSLVEPLGITSPNQQFYGQMRPNSGPQPYQQITNLPPTPRGAFAPSSAIVGKSVGGIIPMPNSSLNSLSNLGNPMSTGVLDPTPGAQQNYPPPHQMSQYPPQYQQQMQQNIQAIKQQQQVQGQGQTQQPVQAPSDPQSIYMNSDWAVSQDQYEVDFRTLQFFDINKDIEGVRKEIADMQKGIFPQGVQMTTAEMLNASQNRLTQLTQQRDEWRKNNEGLPPATDVLGKLMNAYANPNTNANKKFELYTLISDFKDGRYPPKGRIDAMLASVSAQTPSINQPPSILQAPISKQQPILPSIQPFTPLPTMTLPATNQTVNAWNPLPSGNEVVPSPNTGGQVAPNTSEGSWSF